MIKSSSAIDSLRQRLGALPATAALAFIIALTGAMTPGPMLALVVGQVLAQGITAALWILLGHAIIEIVFILGLAHGLGSLLSRNRVRAALSAVGGLVLIWMGWDIFRHAGVTTLAASEGEALSAFALVLGGIGVSLSNPYFTGWWATVGISQIATLNLRKVRNYIAFYIGHELGDVVWYLFVAVILVTGKSWLTDRYYQILLATCGILVFALGILFMILAMRLLRKTSRETVRS